MRRNLSKHVFACVAILLICLNVGFPVGAAGDPITTETELLTAIVGAEAGDTIEIEADITLSASAVLIEKEITIQSAAGGPFTLTQANDKIRHFEVTATGKLTLQNIVLDGLETGGGVDSSGILILGQDSVFMDCKANYGGAVNSSGTFTIKQGAKMEDCVAGGNGGAIYIAGGQLTMEGGTISGSKATDFGGGVYVADGGFTMEGGTISHNSVLDSGGGIFIFGENTTFTMTGGLVTENEATKEGGGLVVLKASAKITAGTFSSNVAGEHGGGIFNDDGATLTIYNAIVTGNTAQMNGGGMWICPNGSAVLGELSGAALYDNTASAKGGQDVYLDARAATTVDLAHMSLGGGNVKWYDEVAGDYVTGLFDLIAQMSLTTKISADDIAKAEAKAQVIITGNEAKNGGGLGINGLITMGKRAPERTELEVEKSWEGDMPKGRPPFITVYLVINGVKQNDVFITLNETKNWKGTFEDLPFADAFGVPIIYSVEEVVPGGYIAGYSVLRFTEDGTYEIIITNTRTAFIDLIVEKVWEDIGEDYKLPDYILIFLVVNGVKQNKVIRLEESNDWKGQFSDLEYRDDDGPIVYTVEEEVPEFFEVTYGEVIMNKEGNYVTVIKNALKTIIIPDKKPETGVSLPTVWVVLLGLGASGLCATALYGRKQRKKRAI